MRSVAIYCKGSDMHVTMCVSVLPNRFTPGSINGSDVCWHDVITDVPNDVSDAEVLRRLRGCVLWKTHTARFDQLRPGAIVKAA